MSENWNRSFGCCSEESGTCCDKTQRIMRYRANRGPDIEMLSQQYYRPMSSSTGFESTREPRTRVKRLEEEKKHWEQRAEAARARTLKRNTQAYKDETPVTSFEAEPRSTYGYNPHASPRGGGTPFSPSHAQFPWAHEPQNAFEGAYSSGVVPPFEGLAGRYAGPRSRYEAPAASRHELEMAPPYMAATSPPRGLGLQSWQVPFERFPSSDSLARTDSGNSLLRRSDDSQPPPRKPARASATQLAKSDSVSSFEAVPAASERGLFTSSAPATPPVGPALGLRREYSALSQRTISRIGEIGSSISQLELAFETVQKELESHAIDAGKARDQLAQLHGDVGKVLFNQLDAVETMDLNSGKSDARTERKSLANRCQSLMDNIEAFRDELPSIPDSKLDNYD